MKIITISGLDGSGKSTQISLLKDFLESQGKKVYYFHAVDFSLANKLAVSKSSGAKSVVKASLPKIMLRRIFLMVDLIRFKSLRNKLRNSGYDYILSDRYFYDTVINIKYLSKNDKKLPCEKFILPPDFSIYLKADPEMIMQRERKPDQGLEYLKDKNKLYDAAAVNWNMKIIDGNRDKEEIFNELKAYL